MLGENRVKTDVIGRAVLSLPTLLHLINPLSSAAPASDGKGKLSRSVSCSAEPLCCPCPDAMPAPGPPPKLSAPTVSYVKELMNSIRQSELPSECRPCACCQPCIFSHLAHAAVLRGVWSQSPPFST